MTKVLLILREGRVAVQSELAQVDQSIAALAALPGSDGNPAVAILLQGRERLQLQLDELDRTIARVKAFGEGEAPQQSTEGEGKRVIPGQYMGLKLSTAVQSYLVERGRGPIGIARMVQDLIAGGFQILQSRAMGANRGKLRDPNTRDIRLLAQNNRKRFIYSVDDDTVALRPAPGNDSAWNDSTPKSAVSKLRTA